MKVRTEINSVKIASNLRNNEKLWTFASSEWKRLITPYVPYEIGNLSQNVDVKPRKLVYNAPYAKRMYYGEGFNFRKDKHPLAGAKWSDQAKATQRPKLIRSLQAYIKKVDI